MRSIELNPQFPDHLQRLLDRFERQERSHGEIWPEASDLSLDDLNLLAELLQREAKGWDQEAALAFLAMSQSEVADRALRTALESTDVRLAGSALTAIAELWPDTRFRLNVQRYVRDTTVPALFCITAACALYRMGEREGFEVLVRYAVGDGTEPAESPLRQTACSFLMKYTRSKDLATLVPLLGEGAYLNFAFCVNWEKAAVLLPVLKEEFSRARRKDFLSFLLCQLGDREAFEYTKGVLLNRDEKTNNDYPIVWALDAIVGLYTPSLRPWSSEELCPFVRELLLSEIQGPGRYGWGFIRRVILELQRCQCTGEAYCQLLDQLQAHVERDTQWADKEKASVLNMITHVRGTVG